MVRWCFKCGGSFDTDQTQCPRCGAEFAGVPGPTQRAGFVSENELTRFFSREFGVPEINLAGFEIDDAVIATVPADIARKYKLIPVNLAGASIIIAMADPSNIFAIDEIVSLSGRNVEVVVASESAIEDAIKRHYGLHGHN